MKLRFQPFAIYAASALVFGMSASGQPKEVPSVTPRAPVSLPAGPVVLERTLEGLSYQEAVVFLDRSRSYPLSSRAAACQGIRAVELPAHNAGLGASVHYCYPFGTELIDLPAPAPSYYIFHRTPRPQ